MMTPLSRLTYARGPSGVGRGERIAVSQTYAQALELLRPPAQPPTGEVGRMIVERAAALLAGRSRCRIAEAHRQLLRMAADRRRDLIDVSHGVIRLLDVTDPAPEPERPPSVPELVAAALDGAVADGPETAEPVRRFEPTIAMIQRVLDVAPGMCGYLTAEHDDAGRLVDLIWRAASPEARTVDGRRGSQLIGERASVQWPAVLASDRWQIYQGVLDTGVPAVVGPFPQDEGVCTVRAHRLGDGLLINWSRLDRTAGESERVAGTERLGNLGWGEWDLVSGEVYWSSQLYRIYERDPSLGPLSQAESEALNLPEDEPLRQAALATFNEATQVDITTRIRIGDRIKHLRTVADAVRDAAGLPLRIYGIVQDVTDRENAARRLAEVERQLADEHELAGRLQQIILPIPDGPIELPGLRVALRYLPAGQESLVGGDWFEATRLRDGSVLLAVGDVAGHGTPAATTMAQLRHALRALAVTTGDPGVLLGHLNRLTCDLERDNPELSATAVVARFCPNRNEIVWAQAGHPPPLLSRDGRTVPLTRPPGPMLGVIDDAAYPTERLTFAAGDVLLLYTDGLVEHRRRGLDDGLAQVIREVDDAVRASPQQPLAQLLDRLRQANPDDDTCILAARPMLGEVPAAA
jgi:serine phosphatase RsbU (regulator of sigma subunit)/PAS domain-containing protein